MLFKALRVVSGGLLLASAGCGLEGDVDEPITESVSALEAEGNDYGVAESFHTTGAIDFTNPMFLQLGTNPRSCATCHGPDQGWAMTAERSKELFKESDGLDPLFNLVDEGSRPDADISTKHLRKAVFSTTVNLAVTRFTRNITPAAAAAAEYTITAVTDPSGFPSTPSSFLNFRRPTHMVNETKMSSILNTSGPVQDIPATLANLFNGAAGLHLQRDVVNNPVPVEQRNQGRDFLLGLFFAQIKDKHAGRLDAAGANGGPAFLSTVPFYLGINTIPGPDPMGQVHTRKVFNIFDAWAVYANDDDCHGNKRDEARGAIYRGQEIFNFHEFTISGVRGFNEHVGENYVGTCASCHNVPNVGGHAVIRMMDIGTTDEANCNPAFPMLTVQHKVTGEVRRTCDLGRGQGSGLWNEIGAFRVPPLRGLAARAPYFHDGQAKNIKQAIRYHEERFNINLSHGKRRDLEAFLGAL
jgi:hypothetical protein